MNNLLIRYRITTNRGSGFNVGNFINVYWDDVGLDYVVVKYTDALDNVGAVVTSGPDLGADRYDHVIVSGYTYGGSVYKFCDSTTLNTFIRDSLFPYAERVQTPNHFSCDVVVCDIRIIGSESTDASDAVTADGSILITADTSSPDIRYSLNSDFSSNQLSGHFTGLIAGTYTVYAKDARGCSANVTVVVGTPTGYGPKYRLEYYDLNHKKTRVDILERGYSGEIIEVCGAADPFILKYNGDGELNKFLTVVPSEARLTLESPSNFYFRELFSQDERKYKLEYYKDFGVIVPAVQNIPALNTFINDDGGGTLIRPHWTLGSNPSVTLPADEDDSIFLSGVVDLAVGAIEIAYNVDVTDHECILIVSLYNSDNAVGRTVIPLIIGNNTGTFSINGTDTANRLKIIVAQDIEQFTPVVNWFSRSETNRVPWGVSGSSQTVNLQAVSGFQISQNLYAYYPFIEGRTYTVEAEIQKTVFSGSPNTSVYFSGRTDSFFATYSPFGKSMNGGTGTYTMSITFTAVTDMTIFAMQLYVTGAAANIVFVVNSIVITNTSGTGTTATINELSSSTAEISGFKLKWTGFVISPNYKEPYKPDPYPVTIVATDGLADLKKADFVDRYGNKFLTDIVTLDAVANILKKTDLGLNIITAVNRLEVSMSTNALTESMFNPATFYDDDNGTITNCLEALEGIIKTFAVRIFQRDGKWIIMTVEEAVHEFQAMEFDSNAVFVQTLAIQDITAITGPIVEQDAAFIWVDQTLEVVPAYGVLTFEHSLIQNPSLIKSYSFEADDVFVTTDGVTAFKAWNVNIEDAPGAEYGIKETKSFQGLYNFFYKVPVIPYAEPGYTLILTSTNGLIEYDANDLFEYRFDYSMITGNPAGGVRPHYPFWVRIKWSLKIGAFYFDDITGEWTTSKKYNDVYCDAFNDAQNYKIVGPMRSVAGLTLEQFQVEFVFFDQNEVDAEISDSSYSALKAIPTVDLNEGYRVKCRIEYTNRFGINITFVYFQLSFEDSDGTDDKNIRPNDYDADTNVKVWVLQETAIQRRAIPRGGEFLSYIVSLNPLSTEVPIKYHYLDNVVLRLLPKGSEPPANITIERKNNLNIKLDYADTFTFNDVDIENINNSERIYKNYFKKLDGTPTQVWERTYRSGQGKLMELYSDDFLSQYKEACNKLTGSLLLKNEITFATVLRELFDSNKLYMLMGMELHDKEYSIQFDMLELKDVVNDDKSDAVDAGFTTGFTLGFRA